MQQDPKDLLEKTVELIDKGDYQGALHYLDKALELDPKFALGWTTKSLALYAQGKYEEAITCFDKALKLDPDNTLAWTGKGWALGILGRYEEAITCFDKALELDPKYTQAWNNKGVALGKLEKYKEAEEALRKAVGLDKDNFVCLNNWGDFLLKLKRYDDAEKAYNRAKELKESWEPYLGFAKVYVGLGDELNEKELYEDALENLGVVLRSGITEEEKKEEKYYFLRGYTNAMLGRWKEAEQDFLKCGGDPKAKRNIRRIRNRLKIEGPTSRTLAIGGWTLAGISITGLIVSLVLYCFHFQRTISEKLIEAGAEKTTEKVVPLMDADLLKVLVPAFLFFLALGVSLPYIRSIRGPGGIGFEKEIVIRPEMAPPELKLEPPKR